MEPFFFLASSFFLRRFRRRRAPLDSLLDDDDERLGDLRLLLPRERDRDRFFLSSFFLSSEAPFFLDLDGARLARRRP